MPSGRHPHPTGAIALHPKPCVPASPFPRRGWHLQGAGRVCVWGGSVWGGGEKSDPLLAALRCREPCSPPACTGSIRTRQQPRMSTLAGGTPWRCWLFLLPGMLGSLQSTLVCSEACRRNPQAPRQSNQPNNDFPCTCACCNHFYHFATLHWPMDFFSSFALFFITIIFIFIITSLLLMAFRFEPPMNLRARSCHDKNIVVYILCQSII